MLTIHKVVGLLLGAVGVMAIGCTGATEGTEAESVGSASQAVLGCPGTAPTAGAQCATSRNDSSGYALDSCYYSASGTYNCLQNGGVGNYYWQHYGSSGTINGSCPGTQPTNGSSCTGNEHQICSYNATGKGLKSAPKSSNCELVGGAYKWTNYGDVSEAANTQGAVSNKVANASFNTNLTSWTSTGSSGAACPSSSGNVCAYVNNYLGTHSGANYLTQYSDVGAWNQSTTQTVSSLSVGSHVLTFWYRSSELGGTGYAKASACLTPTGGTQVCKTLNSTGFSATTTWFPVSITATVPSGQNAMKIEFKSTAAAQYESLAVDDVTLK